MTHSSNTIQPTANTTKPKQSDYFVLFIVFFVFFLHSLPPLVLLSVLLSTVLLSGAFTCFVVLVAVVV